MLREFLIAETISLLLDMAVEKIKDDLYVQPGLFGGYSQVFPFKREDGTWHKRNTTLFFIKVGGIIILAILLLTLWRQDVGVCQNMVNDNFTACKICNMQKDIQARYLLNGSINASNIIWSGGVGLDLSKDKIVISTKVGEHTPGYIELNTSKD